MPPKKRNRDVEVEPEPDPDQLDTDELKGMLRQSLDEKAELVAKMGEMKKEFEGKNAEQEKEIDQLLLHRIFLHFCPREQGTANGEVGWIYYPNCRGVQQAEAAGTTGRLNLASATASPEMGFADSYIYNYPVTTCTEVVDIFENGLKAGAVLKDKDQDESSLFSLVVVTHRENPTTVPTGEESKYLVVAARSDDNRYNSLLAAYLDKDFKHQPMARTYDVLFRSDEDIENPAHKYDQDIQNRVQVLEINDYGTVLKDVWVIDAPDANGRVRGHKADLDFDRMVEVAAGCGTETEMGFWFE